MFGLFSKEKSLQRTIDKASNKFAQNIDRMAALDKLRDMGTEDALVGLCKRFAVTCSTQVEDEQEKLWVVSTLTNLKEEAFAPVCRYIKGATQLSFALRVLQNIATKDQALALVDEVLAQEKPGYTRDPARRIDLFTWLSEWQALSDDELLSRTSPYLADFDENVRYCLVDAFADKDIKLSAPVLIAALTRPEEESGRIKLRIAEILGKAKIPLAEAAPRISGALANLASPYRVENGFLVSRNA